MWKNDKYNGFGTQFRYTDGNTDCKGDEATLDLQSGGWEEMYEGQWKEGKKNGIGIEIISYGLSKYIGNFGRMTKPYGDGTYLAYEKTTNTDKKKDFKTLKGLEIKYLAGLI